MKKIIISIVTLIIAAFLWWTVSPLFITTEVNDELSPAITAALEASNETPVTSLDTPSIITVGDPVIGQPKPVTPVVTETDDTTQEIPAVQIATTPTPEPTTEGLVVTGPFSIVDTPGHGATGNVRVIESDEENIVRFENYDGTNGPDLFVYLAKDLGAEEFVNLGRAKGNMGNINYTVPEDVDLSEYKYVMTWCRAFGVLFDYAEIN